MQSSEPIFARMQNCSDMTRMTAQSLCVSLGRQRAAIGMDSDKLFTYDQTDPLSVYNRSFFCQIRQRFSTFLRCPECRHFPCRNLSRTDMLMLLTSPFLNRTVTDLKPQRRPKMHILKKYDGTLELIEDFDEKNPDQALLQDVQEVYPITKILVPQLKLVPKTKEERASVKEGLEAQKEKSNQDSGEAAKATPGQGGKSKAKTGKKSGSGA